MVLGDYVDRGPDSRGTLDRLLELRQQCQLIPLLGNHDQMMLWICDGRMELMSDWRLFGGEQTLESYGRRMPEGVPAEHLDFLRQCRLIYETQTHFFLHGNYWASVPLDRQETETLLWDSLKRRLPGPHCSGKTGIVGHSSQKRGRSPRPRLPQVHRHLLLRHRLAHRDGRRRRPRLAGRQGGPLAAFSSSPLTAPAAWFDRYLAGRNSVAR